ncbi:MAG: S8 family peptidase [Dehalococcoidia bacterium]
MPNELLPIKVILPTADRHVREQPGGSPRKVFDPVTPAVRRRLSQQVAGVRDLVEGTSAAHPSVPPVAMVQLKNEALAKSHRPVRVLREDTCPIIGVSRFNELLVRASVDGLQRLEREITQDTTSEGVANISTISEVRPFTELDRLGIEREQDVEAIQARVSEDGFIKVELFDYRDTRINRAVRADFTAFLASIGSSVSRTIRYTPDLDVILVSAGPASVMDIVRHPGIRQAGVVPRFFAVRPTAIPVADAVSVQLPHPDPSLEYPIVAVVDAGVAASCGPLSPWVVGEEVFVPPAEQNRDHGTFVAGLIAFGSELNIPGVCEAGGPCQVLDVVVIPNSDPVRGVTGTLTEVDLVASLNEVVPKYASRVKVWNLSLASEEVCLDTQFSSFARALDSLQREHDVQFVVAAGNYQTAPSRRWPINRDLAGTDRICAPADAVTAITVGAIAHAQTLTSAARVGEPSPFSRRGPGPSHLVKPDLVHYGGNCDDRYSYQTTGMRSLDPTARIVEDIGTSYSTPLVSGLLGNVLNAFDPMPSRNLAKALVIHSASVPDGLLQEGLHYYGYGLPNTFARLIHATQESATLVFEDVLQPGYILELDPFPFPACLLTNGKSFGQIRMTLVYEPPLDPTAGLEYCRANVSASLGTATLDRDGKLRHKRQVHPFPDLSGQGHERSLIEQGFKWSPVKCYQRTITNGVAATHWRLRLELLHRSGEQSVSQPFALVISISGDDGLPVYDDVVAALRSHASTDLRLKTSIYTKLDVEL